MSVPRYFSMSAANRLRRRHHAIDDRICETRERHRGGIDHLLLCLPFGGDRLGKLSPGRCEELAPPAERTGLPSSSHSEAALAFLIADRRILVEPRPARFGPCCRRADSIGSSGLVLENVLEDVTHAADWSHRILARISGANLGRSVVIGIVRRSKPIRRCDAR